MLYNVGLSPSHDEAWSADALTGWLVNDGWLVIEQLVANKHYISRVWLDTTGKFLLMIADRMALVNAKTYE